MAFERATSAIRCELGPGMCYRPGPEPVIARPGALKRRLKSSSGEFLPRAVPHRADKHPNGSRKNTALSPPAGRLCCALCNRCPRPPARPPAAAAAAVAVCWLVVAVSQCRQLAGRPVGVGAGTRSGAVAADGPRRDGLRDGLRDGPARACHVRSASDCGLTSLVPPAAGRAGLRSTLGAVTMASRRAWVRRPGPSRPLMVTQRGPGRPSAEIAVRVPGGGSQPRRPLSICRAVRSC